MTVNWMQPADPLTTARGEVIVCIPVFGGHEEFVTCLRSVLQHTPPEVKVLICDDASPDSRSSQFVDKLEGSALDTRQLYYVRREQNLGFPGNVNRAFAAAAPADVVVLNSDCAVGAGWLEGLRDAAYSDSTVATATALTNNGSIVSVPDRARPAPGLPPDWSLDDAAAAIHAGSLRLRPRLPTAIGHCVYIRRSALELVGEFDLAFSPGYGEEVDFSQRCLRSGLSHVLADDVFVFHSGGASFSSNGRRDPIQEEHERVLAARYPYYHPAIRAIEKDSAGPLARALSAARRALNGLSVMIDARILDGPMTGTQVHVLQLVSALSRTGRLRITVIVPDDLSGYAALTLESLPDVALITRSEASDAVGPPVDLVHRPHQISNDEDVSFLAPLAERLIVTNQDLIGYHNPSYFSSYEKWEGYRRLTRSALALADRVAFFSAHARDDALSEDLVEPERASVVHIGVDHLLAGTRFDPVAPRAAARIPDGVQTILCLGTDFRHKNRIFALRLLEELQRRHDWAGLLLLAGPRVTEGSSLPEEAELLALHPGLAGAVIDVAAVREAEKAWLFERSQLVLYPTVHEGFGLVPFEAADHAVPCMWAPGTSLSEVLPDAAGGIVAWDVSASADNALELLRDEAARARNVAAIRAAAAGLTWDATAAKLIELYQLTCDTPATPASGLARRHGIMRGIFSEDAMRLVGPGGALPRDVERPLLALATHPQIGRPLFRAMKAGYRASRRLSKRPVEDGDGTPKNGPVKRQGRSPEAPSG